MLKLMGAICIMLASLGGFAQLRSALQKRTLELLGWLGPCVCCKERLVGARPRCRSYAGL